MYLLKKVWFYSLVLLFGLIAFISHLVMEEKQESRRKAAVRLVKEAGFLHPKIIKEERIIVFYESRSHRVSLFTVSAINSSGQIATPQVHIKNNSSQGKGPAIAYFSGPK